MAPGTTTLGIDREGYVRLLAALPPVKIRTPEQAQATERQLEALLARPALSAAERADADLLTGDPGILRGTLRGKLSFPWDMAIVPCGRVAHVDTVKGPNLVLSAGIKQPEAAWAWLAHYNGVEMRRYIATNGKIVSARKSALKAFVDLPEGYNKQAIAQAAAMGQAAGTLAAVAARSGERPHLVPWAAVRDELQRPGLHGDAPALARRP